MTMNGISYSIPFDKAWQRMKMDLFQPFDLGHWFVLGFGAFLASLGEGGGGGTDGLVKISDRLDREPVGDWSGSTGQWLDTLVSNSGMLMLAGFLMMLGLGLMVLFLWLSSRGQFVFLDNLVTGQAAVKRPWNDLAAQGDSLFRWRLGFGLVCLVVFGAFAGLMVVLFVPMKALDVSTIAVLPVAVLAGTVGFVLITVAVYIEFFLNNFVSTIMYRERISATEAWAIFKPLFKEHPGSFVAYGLLHLVAAIIGSLALALAGILACCVGLVLLMIPYVSSVVSLPLTVTLRFWDLEFLGQFGDRFAVLVPFGEVAD
jgi:hypothetical protein